MSLTIGVDVGGTKILGGVVDLEGIVLATCRRQTPTGGVGATRDVIVQVIRELAAAYEVAAVGIGVTGLVDPARSTVVFSTNLQWRDEPLQEHVQSAIGLPVAIENDANAAAWAEFRYGAARDAGDSAVMVTVGTGIGGGVVFGGRLLRGATGMAGEVGHMVVAPGGVRCGCGRVGCLDRYASGSALIRFAREGAAARPSVLSGVDELTGAMVTDAARAGDPVALEAFGEIAHWLAEGVIDTLQLLDPQVVVLGGGVAESGDLLMAPLLAALDEAVASRGEWSAARIRRAVLGNAAGLIGAADLARLG